MIPLAAALSSRLTAMRRSSPAVSAPEVVDRMAVLMRVLTSALLALLRRRRRSFCRLRLIWLLMLATGVLAESSGNPEMVAGGPWRPTPGPGRRALPGHSRMATAIRRDTLAGQVTRRKTKADLQQERRGPA